MREHTKECEHKGTRLFCDSCRSIVNRGALADISRQGYIPIAEVGKILEIVLYDCDREALVNRANIFFILEKFSRKIREAKA